MTSEQNFIGQRIENLPTPTFVVDLDAFTSNCKRMLKTAAENGIKLRGQVKTHKTVEGGIIQTGGTKRGLVTSTIVESEMFAEAGFDDILYGYPILEIHMERNFKLREMLDEYHLFVTNMEAIDILTRYPPPRGKKWSVFLKIDCGYPRAGVFWNDKACIELAKEIQKNGKSIRFQGLYVHCGNSYSAKKVHEVHQVRDNSVMMLVEVKKRMREAGIHVSNIGIGSTPSCSHSGDSMKNLTEIHPGNYVFYDSQQLKLGSCKEEDIAGRVLTRILGHYPRRKQMLIDCGFLGLTNQGYQELDCSYALVKDHPHLKVTGMTQEIGYIESSKDCIEYEKFPVGSILTLLPYHNCATASCYQKYFVHKDGIIKFVWAPCKGW